jgi:hypothetical protein
MVELGMDSGLVQSVSEMRLSMTSSRDSYLMGDRYFGRDLFTSRVTESAKSGSHAGTRLR